MTYQIEQLSLSIEASNENDTPSSDSECCELILSESSDEVYCLEYSKDLFKDALPIPLDLSLNFINDLNNKFLVEKVPKKSFQKSLVTVNRVTDNLEIPINDIAPNSSDRLALRRLEKISSKVETHTTQKETTNLNMLQKLLSCNILKFDLKSILPTNRYRKTLTKTSEMMNQNRLGTSYAYLLIDENDDGNSNAPVNVIGNHTQICVTEDIHISMVPVTCNKKNREKFNRELRLIHPWLNPSLTFSKLQNLKYDLFTLIEKVTELDPSTVAMAWVYFEKLLKYQVVTKKTRKQLAGACIVIAFKFNQALRLDKLSTLIQAIRCLDRKDHLKAEDIFAVEFLVFAALKFKLKLLYSDISSHLNEYFNIFSQHSFESEYSLSESKFKLSWIDPVVSTTFMNKTSI